MKVIAKFDEWTDVQDRHTQQQRQTQKQKTTKRPRDTEALRNIYREVDTD